MVRGAAAPNTALHLSGCWAERDFWQSAAEISMRATAKKESERNDKSVTETIPFTARRRRRLERQKWGRNAEIVVLTMSRSPSFAASGGPHAIAEINDLTSKSDRLLVHGSDAV
jgi:hypothetical protein